MSGETQPKRAAFNCEVRTALNLNITYLSPQSPSHSREFPQGFLILTNSASICLPLALMVT